MNPRIIGLVALFAVPLAAQAKTAVIGSTLSEARAKLAALGVQRRDCDPVPDGRWICADFNNPVLADVASTPTAPAAPSAPSTPTAPAPTTPAAPQGGRVAVYGATLGQARENYAAATTLRRVDCDAAGGGYVCASFNNPTAADVGLSSPTAPAAPVRPSTPASPAAPSNPSSGSTALIVQAEDGIPYSGSGWSTESALGGAEGGRYIVWRGADDFRTSDRDPPRGILAYDFRVTRAGIYQFTARTRARVGNGNAASDKDNDAWVKFTSGSHVAGVRGRADKWTKFFTSGADERWKPYTNGEQYDPTFKTPIRRYLPVGTHRILIGGRSARFAIDNVGLRPAP